MPRIITLFFLFLILPLSAQAESRYVTDQILIALRPEQNDTSAPLEYLPTGTRVELVQDLGAFLQIKSASGNLGFARSKYFLPTPPAGTSATTAALQEKLTNALKEVDVLREEIQKLKTTPAANALTTLPPETEESRAETATIVQERDDLKKEVARLTDSNRDTPPSAAQSELSQLQWFMAGAAILLLGWLAGKSSRPKRRF